MVRNRMEVKKIATTVTAAGFTVAMLAFQSGFQNSIA